MALVKGKALLEASCVFSEFGTRRRRSYYIQDLVVKTLIQAARDMPGKGTFAGTSNVGTFCSEWSSVARASFQVHLAQKHDIAPIGTIAQYVIDLIWSVCY